MPEGVTVRVRYPTLTQRGKTGKASASKAENFAGSSPAAEIFLDVEDRMANDWPKGVFACQCESGHLHFGDIYENL